jgi:hypothetical protein
MADSPLFPQNNIHNPDSLRLAPIEADFPWSDRQYLPVLEAPQEF